MNNGKKLKILQIVRASEGANWLYNIVSIQKREGHDVKVAICAPYRQSKLFEKLKNSQIPFFVFDVSGHKIYDIPKILKNSFKLFNFIKKERFNVVHYHLVKAIFLGRILAFLAKVPVRISQWPGYLYTKIPLYFLLDKLTYKMDSVVIASSKYTKNLLLKNGFQEKKIKVIYYGMYLDKFVYDGRKAKDFKEKYGLEGFRTVGMIAYMYPPSKHSGPIGIKGHEYFIEAAKIVTEKKDDVKFVIIGDELIGDGSYRQYLEEMVKNRKIKDKVIFTGFIEDTQAALSALDIVCVPSTLENLGGVVEPLIMGKPVIASNVGGLPEAVIHEKTGLLFEAGDINGLASSIIRFLENPKWATSLAKKGSEHIKSFMDIEKTTKEIENTYYEILAKNKQRDGNT